MVLLGGVTAQPEHAKPFDPRHFKDRRCPGAVTLDDLSKQRDPASVSSYLKTPMKGGSTVHDCAELCCGDWSCEAFAFCKNGEKCGAEGYALQSDNYICACLRAPTCMQSGAAEIDWLH